MVKNKSKGKVQIDMNDLRQRTFKNREKIYQWGQVICEWKARKKAR